jgi:predicted nucleotidyltransferase
MITEDIIKNKLAEIENRENIRIIFACESGSRAWGFASKDSDYDVRFVYVRRLRDYLKIKDLPDFIEGELNEVYDINGWDLRKFLVQVSKSNPVMFEWANSPIVYKSSAEWEKIKKVMSQYSTDKAMFCHYLGMAKRNCQALICESEKEEIKKRFSYEDLANAISNSDFAVVYKKYLYVLRPILACCWVMKKHSVVPTEFSKLVNSVLPDELRGIVEELLMVKKNGREKDCGQRFPEIDSFIASTLIEAGKFSDFYSNNCDFEKLNSVFFEIVNS